MHGLLVVAIPTLAVMFGILLNRQDAMAIRSEMVALRNSIHHDMIGLHERVATVEAKHGD